MNRKDLDKRAWKIDEAVTDLRNVKDDFLRAAGWRYSSELCSTWLWTREIDGRVLYVGTDTAVDMTSRL